LTYPTGHRSKALGYLKAAIAVSVWLPGSAAIFGSYAGGLGAYVVAGFVSGTITGGLQGGLEGAFTAALFYGIDSHFLAGAKGSGFLGSGLKGGKFAQKVLAHATAGGTISVLQGGKFGHGFVGAGVTEAVSPVITNLHSDFAKVAASAMVGGSTSYLAGGKFGNGAATGAFAMMVSLGMANSGASNGSKGGGYSDEDIGVQAENFEDDFLSVSGMEGGDVEYESGSGGPLYNYDVYVTGDRGQNRAGPYRGSISPDSKNRPACMGGGCSSVADGDYGFFADNGIYGAVPNKRYLMLRIGNAARRDGGGTMSGVWVHKGFKTGTYAEGCLTVHMDDWSNFIGNFSRGSNGIVRVKK
jgi:hypothetical protein